MGTEKVEDSPQKAHAVNSETEMDLERARDAFREADAAHRKAQSRVNELDDKLKRDYGESFKYFSLDDRCVEKHLGEYLYKICFFKNVKQNHFNLGNYKGFEKNEVMSFTDGENCPGGPHRSMTVHFVCGVEQDILSVLEPSRCTYEAHVSHPIGCREKDLELLTDSA